MTKYRKKPVDVEVWRWDGSFDNQSTWPKWLKSAYSINLVGYIATIYSEPSLIIGDRGDPEYIHIGDYVINEPDMPLYGYNKDEFINDFEKGDE
jgi:hypothetical protein